MKGIQKVQLTGIALVVAQLACTSAYAQQTPNTELPIQCLPGDGNSFLSASPQTTVNTEAQKQQLAVAYVKEFQHIFNLTSTQAAGVVANLLWESGLNSGMKNVTGSLGEAVKQGDAVDRTGYGVAQWIMERKFKLIEVAAGLKIPTSSQCANFNHLGNELIFEPTFAKVIPAVHAEKNLIGAVCSFEKLYQIPKDPNSSNRIQLARNIMSWLGESYVEGHGSASGDACDYYPGPQPDGSNTSSNSTVAKSYVDTGGGSGNQKPPHGFANNWTTVRFSNTTNEVITTEIVMQAGQALPEGVKPTVPLHGIFTIAAGGYVDIPFGLNTGPNFASRKGDGSAWSQGEAFFEEKIHASWFDVSYIYGANSNIRMFCEDGQHSGYLGDIIAGAPPEVRAGNWGIKSPFQDRLSNDRNNPNSAMGGPNGPHNAAAGYLYSKLKKGEGYVHRGNPAEIDTYDDASSLRCNGRLAVVF
ncbi:phage tail tip lysozyme [Herbaspirillum sp. ST 5-3]|uniref:phage tail tip lysozyme n=1 Tax=Oxalobacteraceae TaxID=75682 RepID=UPI0010A2E25A|nr:phage tail tip lysozyme [Herbaspirillum sp. ST 5-3]